MHAEAYVVLICFNKVSIKLKTVQAAPKKKKYGNMLMGVMKMETFQLFHF